MSWFALSTRQRLAGLVAWDNAQWPRQGFSSLIQQNEDRKLEERIRVEGLREAYKIAEKRYYDTWHAVLEECSRVDNDPNSDLKIAPFSELYELLKSYQLDSALPEMREKFATMLNDIAYFRPGQIFFVSMLIEAGKPETTAEQFAADAKKFQPAWYDKWRTQVASDIRELYGIRKRIKEEENARQRWEQEQAENQNRLTQLRETAEKRGAIKKQLFALYWQQKGLGPAAIRDKWNAANPRDPISDGEGGRDDIKKSVERIQGFIAKNNTSLEQLMELLEYSFE